MIYDTIHHNTKHIQDLQTRYYIPMSAKIIKPISEFSKILNRAEILDYIKSIRKKSPAYICIFNQTAELALVYHKII